MDSSCLPYKSDRYNGVTISEASLPKDPNTFDALLSSSLTQWISEKKRGVWLKIPIELSSLISIGVNQGKISLISILFRNFIKIKLSYNIPKVSYILIMYFIYSNTVRKTYLLF